MSTNSAIPARQRILACRPQQLQCAPMHPADFHFDLPQDLIAQEPLSDRLASRLLHVRPGAADYPELRFAELGKLLNQNDLLVFNDTRVLPARLFGQKASGGKVEMLLERILEPDLALVQLRSSRSPKIGAEIEFEGGARARVEGRADNFFVLRFDASVEAILEQHGHMPLPPYIERADESRDRERYQTVYAREPGAVAAPTAGLHFDQTLLAELATAGVEQAFITLHVGAGTFQALRDEQLASGRLHAERIVVDKRVVDAVEQTRRAGGRVVAVGTTVVRALETAAKTGTLSAYEDETEIFIQPGYAFKVVDALITNFHLPESSLLMLVAAFGGKETLLSAYRHAVAERFRFFSYGDAMFIEKESGPSND